MGSPDQVPSAEKESPSVIDYGMCTDSLLSRINSFYVLPYTILSDHCCLSLSLSTKHYPTSPDEEVSFVTMKEQVTYPKYKPEFLQVFQENLEQDNAFDDIVTTINGLRDKPVTTQVDIDCLVESFQKPILSNAQKPFPTKNI